MIHKHAGELRAHRLGQQGGSHRGVHPPGQGQQYLPLANLLPQLSNGDILVVPHSPVAFGMTDFAEKAADHVHTALGMVDLRVELDAVEAPGLVGYGHVGAGIAVGGEGKALGHFCHVVPMTHPGHPLRGQAPEQLAGGVVVGEGFAVLPGGVVLGGGDLPTQGVGHELTAVADAQNRYPPGENRPVNPGRAVQVDGVRPAGEDDADGVHRPQFSQRSGPGLHLAVHIALPHPAGNELIVLSAKVDDKNFFHAVPPCVICGSTGKNLVLHTWAAKSRGAQPALTSAISRFSTPATSFSRMFLQRISNSS